MAVCESIEYFHNKYQLTLPHSEVIEATETIKPCKMLDLGCGQGRNSLYLNSLGFDMTCLDVNPSSIAFLNNVIKQEKLSKIAPAVYDINEASVIDSYDFILSTVVFMFLEANRIPDIIHNMQKCTNKGGYNLIVSAMDTDRYPCNQGFSFCFRENELIQYYKDWEILKYNEDVGKLHRLDAAGNRVKLQFATLLAKKN